MRSSVVFVLALTSACSQPTAPVPEPVAQSEIGLDEATLVTDLTSSELDEMCGYVDSIWPSLDAIRESECVRRSLEIIDFYGTPEENRAGANAACEARCADELQSGGQFISTRCIRDWSGRPCTATAGEVIACAEALVDALYRQHEITCQDPLDQARPSLRDIHPEDIPPCAALMSTCYEARYGGREYVPVDVP